MYVRPMAPLAVLAAVALLALPSVAHARPATAARDGRPNILVVMTDDEATAAVAGDVHHRPVRPQPRRPRELLALRLVRDEGPREHAPGLAAQVRLPHGAD